MLFAATPARYCNDRGLRRSSLDEQITEVYPSYPYVIPGEHVFFAMVRVSGVPQVSESLGWRRSISVQAAHAEVTVLTIA